MVVGVVGSFGSWGQMRDGLNRWMDRKRVTDAVDEA